MNGLAGATEWPEELPAAKNCRIGYFGAMSAVQKLSGEADEVVAVFMPGAFYGVEGIYEDFGVVGGEEVMFYPDKLRELVTAV